MLKYSGGPLLSNINFVSRLKAFFLVATPAKFATFLRPMTMETRCSIQKRNWLNIRSYRRYGEHDIYILYIYIYFYDYLFTLPYAAELALSR